MVKGQNVMRQRIAGSLLILAVASVATATHAAEERLPDRRAVVAKPAAAEAATRNTLLDLLRQLEELQTEVRQLRNTVEVQGHELETLKGRQRALYDDLDKRLRDAERRGSATAPVAPASAATAAAPSAPRVTTAAQQQEYDAAFELMKQGLYDRAVKAFRVFLTKYPDSGLADNAQYWIAEGNYVLRNYKLALEEFTKVVSAPQNPKAPDALLKIGYVHYELGAYDKARKTLGEVQERYPGSSVAKLAAVRLDKMKKEGH
jgi:tol-pal system protein YbgF